MQDTPRPVTEIAKSDILSFLFLSRYLRIIVFESWPSLADPKPHAHWAYHPKLSMQQ
jgi:hypothetical protein